MKTIKELEEEIEGTKKVIDGKVEQISQCSFCGSEKKPDNLEYYQECLIDYEATLKAKKEVLELVDEFTKESSKETGITFLEVLIDPQELKLRLTGGRSK